MTQYLVSVGADPQAKTTVGWLHVSSLAHGVHDGPALASPPTLSTRHLRVCVVVLPPCLCLQTGVDVEGLAKAAGHTEVVPALVHPAATAAPVGLEYLLPQGGPAVHRRRSSVVVRSLDALAASTRPQSSLGDAPIMLPVPNPVVKAGPTRAADTIRAVRWDLVALRARATNASPQVRRDLVCSVVAASSG